MFNHHQIIRWKYSGTLAFYGTLERLHNTRHLKVIILFLLHSLIAGIGYAQAPLTHADSIERAVDTLSGAKKADKLLWLTRHYRFIDTRKAASFGKAGILACKNVKDYSLSPLYIELGIDFTILSEYETANQYYDTALLVAGDDKSKQVSVLANRAILLTYQERYTQAIESHLKALDIYKEKGDNDDGIMRTYSNVAWIYSKIHDYFKADKYYRLSHEYAMKLKEPASIYTILGNIGGNLINLGKLDEAKKIDKEVIAYYEAHTPGSVQVGNIYLNMAQIYTAEYKWDSSYYYANRALTLFKDREALREQADTYPVLANAELALGKIKEAELHASLGYRMNKDFKAKNALLENLFTLILIYREKHDHKAGQKYEKEYLLLTDSLERENQSRAVIELQTKYETDSKNRENELLKKENELKDARLAGSRYTILSSLLGLSLMASLAFVLFQKNKNRYRMNKALQTEYEKLKVEMLTAQLNQLKDQINPHFLFNSLATLQSMAQEGDPNTGVFVQKLSEVYRYILQTNSDSLVSLKEELRVAQAYLFMLKARFEGALFISIQISDDLLTKKIPPFSLQLLLENAIKHNSATHAAPLHISITGSGQEISVSNTLQPKRSVVESTKVGLANLRKRFDLLGAKEILIERTKKEFTVRLPLYS